MCVDKIEKFRKIWKVLKKWKMRRKSQDLENPTQKWPGIKSATFNESRNSSHFS